MIYTYAIFPQLPRHNMETAKVFWSGRSQAVRLPKEFRFKTNTVRIRRHGQAVILEPIAQDWTWLDALIRPLDDDFEQAASEQPVAQERPELDFFE
jgi:antitoxin VapB